jgi:hypothetical protein
MMMSRSGSIDDSTNEVIAANSSSALSEPDALSLLLGDMAPAAVGYPRKENLLQQARADRRKWIQKVPLPFASVRDPDNVWMTEDRLAKVQSTPAYSRLPAATKVLSELYGMEDRTRTPEEVATRIETLVRRIFLSQCYID